MKIKSIIKTFFGTALIVAAIPALADTAGLNINNDGAEVHYQGQFIEYKEYRILPVYSALYSQETWHRNLLLRADAEIISYTYTFGEGYTVAPKITALFSDFHNNNIIAPAIGAVTRIPKGGKIPFDIDGEAFWAPPPFALIHGQYLWGITIQGHYPLPQENELRFGIRKIEASVDQGPHGSLETGVFVGLASFF